MMNYFRSIGWVEQKTVLHAGPVCLVILGLFYYWFAVANRHVIFLYEHLGATPFDAMTSSRYWMSGLVACGGVGVGYTAVNWLLGRAAAAGRLNYRPPAWWRVWLFCVGPLAAGIPLITMTFNRPTLPPVNALECVAAALGGLAVALMPGAVAAQRPVKLAWLLADGVGLMPPLLLVRIIELPERGLLPGPGLAYVIALGSIMGGLVWLGLMTGLQLWQRRPPPGAGALWLTGLGLSYLLMPLVHHLLFTPPGYRYISAASNFFAYSPSVQALVFLVAGGLAGGNGRVRRYLSR